MREHRLAVGRTAHYYTLGAASGSLRAVWVVCHGYGQLAARFLSQFESLDDGTRLIVAPEALSRFYVDDAHQKVGASWMTREDRLAEIEDYVRLLDAVHAELFRSIARDKVRLCALGFSQGAATVSRWAALGRARVDRLILWGGELPPDLDLAAAQGRLRAAELVLVAGRRDEFITPKVLAGIEARLHEHGIAYRLEWFDGGHEIDVPTLRRLG